jgi:hypothetical protein
MDTFIIGALIFIVVVALAPFLLMRGQFGKAKKQSGSADGGADVAVMTAAGSGGGKGHAGDSDNADGGSDGGGGGGE